MRCLPVEKDQIERAKAKGLYIVQVCITGQYMTPRDGGYAVTGAFSKKAAKELRDYVWRWHKRHTPSNSDNSGEL